LKPSAVCKIHAGAYPVHAEFVSLQALKTREINAPRSVTENDYQWIRKSISVGAEEAFGPKCLWVSPNPWIRKDEPGVDISSSQGSMGNLGHVPGIVVDHRSSLDKVPSEYFVLYIKVRDSLRKTVIVGRAPVVRSFLLTIGAKVFQRRLSFHTASV